jgi:hypothetical protein
MNELRACAKSQDEPAAFNAEPSPPADKVSWVNCTATSCDASATTRGEIVHASDDDHQPYLLLHHNNSFRLQ